MASAVSPLVGGLFGAVSQNDQNKSNQQAATNAQNSAQAFQAQQNSLAQQNQQQNLQQALQRYAAYQAANPNPIFNQHSVAGPVQKTPAQIGGGTIGQGGQASNVLGQSNAGQSAPGAASGAMPVAPTSGGGMSPQMFQQLLSALNGVKV